jgi:hypothetical protein
MPRRPFQAEHLGVIPVDWSEMIWISPLRAASQKELPNQSEQIPIAKGMKRYETPKYINISLYIYHYIYISLYIHQFQTYPDILITPLEPVRTTCQSLKRQTCQLEDRHTADLHGQSGPGPAGSFPKTAMRPGRSRKSPGKATASVKLYEAIWITIESLIMKLKRLK